MDKRMNESRLSSITFWPPAPTTTPLPTKPQTHQTLVLSGRLRILSPGRNQA